MKITTAIQVTENIQHFKVVKRVAQGWSIVIGSWFDILSGYLLTTGPINNAISIYTTGVKGFYGVGFGFPLLLGLPEETLSCSVHDFHNLLNQFKLTYGLRELFSSGIPFVSVRSVVSEFDVLVRARLGCILDFDSEVAEAADVAFALDDLAAALQLRIALEEERDITDGPQ